MSVTELTMTDEPQDKMVCLSGMRGIIAERMSQSLANAAQLTYHSDVDAEGLFKAREDMAAVGNKLSLEVFLIKAVSNALLSHPEFNGVTTEWKIFLKGSHNIAFAFALDNGLVTLTVRDVQRLSLEEIAAQRDELIARARAGKLQPSDMKDSTFTISNLGLRPVKYFTPILNPGQIALLGIGQTQTVPALQPPGEWGVKRQLPLSLTTDHRAVDGDPSGAFLQALSDALAFN